MSTKKSQPVTLKRIVHSMLAMLPKKQATEPGCRCTHGTFHKGRCGAPTLKSRDGLCTWCRKRHPDHSHHNEHLEKPARTQKTRRH